MSPKKLSFSPFSHFYNFYVMKYIFVFVSFLSANCFATAAQPPVLNTEWYKLCDKKDRTLRAGTLVLLETNEKIFSHEVTVGKTVMFRVRMNVVVDGEVVIPTGAMALGRVKAIQTGTHNVPEEIRLELQYVQAVDGQQIPLNGNEQSFKAQFTGQGSPADTGLSITAQVMNNIEIEVN